MEILDFTIEKRMYFRDRLRQARYAALADAEGFSSICYEIEALGMYIYGKKEALGVYEKSLANLAKNSLVLDELSKKSLETFKRFDTLYALVKSARNDVMHTGVYARHVTFAAIELCIGLEEALMTSVKHPYLVKDLMVNTPITVEKWQSVAFARQLMLTHSFSYIPVRFDEWYLISENSMARYLYGVGSKKWKERMAKPIEESGQDGLKLIKAKVVSPDIRVDALLAEYANEDMPFLWLVNNGNGGIAGVLSSFELM